MNAHVKGTFISKQVHAFSHLLHMRSENFKKVGTGFGLSYNSVCLYSQPRSQGFSLFVIGKSEKGPGTGRSHDFQHPDIVGVNKL